MTISPTPVPPWPLVGECFTGAPSLVAAGHTCPQCDGSHAHEWVTWRQAPEVSPGTVVVDGTSGPGLPVRCRHCGGRKCDWDYCWERRHHSGPHVDVDGAVVRQVGE